MGLALAGGRSRACCLNGCHFNPDAPESGGVMQMSHDFPSRLARCTFTIMMAMAWCGAANPSTASAAEPGHDPTPQDLQRTADAFEKAMKAAAEFDKNLPRDTFDPQVIVRQTGGEPKALLDWVASNTRWVPYQGALRGAAGVLMDRQGNSLDRSLLLAHLLRLSGKSARLAHAKLSDDQARRFVELAVRPREDKPAAPAARDETALNRYAADHGLSPDALRQSMAQMALRANNMAEHMAQRVAEARTELARLVPQPAPNGNPSDDARAAADHWWVQWQQGAQWTDLDPMRPSDAKDITPIQTVEFATDAAQPALDPALWHQIEFRAVIEQWDGH